MVDITNSSLSAHQVGQTGYYASHSKKDYHVNIKVTGGFDFTRGLISCAQLKTGLVDGQVKLFRRSKFGMCGPGHWAQRNKSRYGREEEVPFDSKKWSEYKAKLWKKH